jgi:hypothetical protein
MSKEKLEKKIEQLMNLTLEWEKNKYSKKEILNILDGVILKWEKDDFSKEEICNILDCVSTKYYLKKLTEESPLMLEFAKMDERRAFFHKNLIEYLKHI